MAAMFNKNENLGGINQAETIVGHSVKIEGEFSAEENILIEGEVQGNLKTSKNLVIAESAKVKANVSAQNIKVAGTIEGNVVCQDKIEITTSGKVFGDIQTNIIGIETGAIVKGHCLTGTNSDINKKEKKEDKK
jgi:cytoskeletal protein CcmA (bactofilin family)